MIALCKRNKTQDIIKCLLKTVTQVHICIYTSAFWSFTSGKTLKNRSFQNTSPPHLLQNAPVNVVTHARYKPSQENKRFPVRLIFAGDSTDVTVGTTVSLKIKM